MAKIRSISGLSFTSFESNLILRVYPTCDSILMKILTQTVFIFWNRTKISFSTVLVPFSNHFNFFRNSMNFCSVLENIQSIEWDISDWRLYCFYFNFHSYIMKFLSIVSLVWKAWVIPWKNLISVFHSFDGVNLIYNNCETKMLSRH